MLSYPSEVIHYERCCRRSMTSVMSHEPRPWPPPQRDYFRSQIMYMLTERDIIVHPDEIEEVLNCTQTLYFKFYKAV